MSYEITLSASFERSFKKLFKRYKSLKGDLMCFIKSLEENPLQGDDLGNGLRKIRMSITSKSKGKRGGARVITHNIIISASIGKIRLLAIYDKSDRESLSDKEIKDLLKEEGLL